MKLLEGKDSVLHHSHLLLQGKADGSLNWLPDKLHDVDQDTEWSLWKVRKNQYSSTRREQILQGVKGAPRKSGQDLILNL